MVTSIKNRSAEVLHFPNFSLQPNELKVISWEKVSNVDIGIALRHYHEQKIYFCNNAGCPVVSTRTAKYLKDENGVLVEREIIIDEVLEYLNKQLAKTIQQKNKQVQNGS